MASRAVGDLLEHIIPRDQRINEYNIHLKQLAQTDKRSERLLQLRGVGPMTTTALLSSSSNGHELKNGRQLAAWLGLVAGRHGSGEKTRRGHIIRAGDRYWSALLVLVERALLATAAQKNNRLSRWALRLQGRIDYGKALVGDRGKECATCLGCSY